MRYSLNCSTSPILLSSRGPNQNEANILSKITGVSCQPNAIIEASAAQASALREALGISLERIALGTSVSSQYVRTGKSPGLNKLIDSIAKRQA